MEARRHLILAGRLQDKKGPFWISVIGGVLVSVGFFLPGGPGEGAGQGDRVTRLEPRPSI